jgi:hypothetical protein
MRLTSWCCTCRVGFIEGLQLGGLLGRGGYARVYKGAAAAVVNKSVRCCVAASSTHSCQYQLICDTNLDCIGSLYCHREVEGHHCCGQGSGGKPVARSAAGLTKRAGAEVSICRFTMLGSFAHTMKYERPCISGKSSLNNVSVFRVITLPRCMALAGTTAYRPSHCLQLEPVASKRATRLQDVCCESTH